MRKTKNFNIQVPELGDVPDITQVSDAIQDLEDALSGTLEIMDASIQGSGLTLRSVSRQTKRTKYYDGMSIRFLCPQTITANTLKTVIVDDLPQQVVTVPFDINAGGYVDITYRGTSFTAHPVMIQKSESIDSNSNETVATSKAVKRVNDKINTVSNEVSELDKNKVSKSGDTMTGELTIKGGYNTNFNIETNDGKSVGFGLDTNGLFINNRQANTFFRMLDNGNASIAANNLKTKEKEVVSAINEHISYLGKTYNSFPLTSATQNELYYHVGSNKMYICTSSYNGDQLSNPNSNFEELSVYTNRQRLNNLENYNSLRTLTIQELKAKNNLKIGDIIEIVGYYEKDDGATHKRIIANKDDGSGVQLTNGLWANKLKSLKDINLINSTNFLRLLRNNMDNISFTLMGDSIWYLLPNGTPSPILGNGTSRIYNTMLETLNEYIWKGKLTVAENLTFPGDDSSRAFTRYTEHQFQGDVVLICYGANDTKLDSGTAEGGTSFPVTNVKDTFDRHKKYMEKLIEKVILQGKVPIIIGCTAPKTPTQMQHRDRDPNRQNMVLMADLDKNIADEYGALYISAYDCMKNFDDSIFPGEDQVHPQDGLTHIGKRLANEFIGLMTDSSKYKTQVFGELNLGVRKTFDNFMVSSTESIVRKAQLQCWSNSGEYLDLKEGDCIVYSFYSPEDCIVYPQVIQENGSKITMGVNFNIFESKESKTFKDNNFDMYRRLQFDSTNNVPNRIMCFTSPKTYSIAQKLNTTGFRGMVVPFKLIPKGFNSFYIKSIEGSCKVLGITIEQVSNKVPSYNSTSFSQITSFNQLIQEGRYYFYRGSMTSLINDLPPNYNDDKTDNFAFCDVKVAYDGNLSDPFFVQQIYSTRKGICVRNKTKQTGWGEWFYIRGGVKDIWSIIKDFNEVIPQGEYYGATNHENYNAILNKPDLKGDIIFKVDEIIGVGYSLIAYSSSGIALRFYKNNKWEEWAYLKTNVI